MSGSGTDDRFQLVHAYCDGELDPVNAKAIEQQIAADPVLAAERDRIMALRHLLQTQLMTTPAPVGLWASIERSIGLKTRRLWPMWNAIAASLVGAVLLFAVASWYFADLGDHGVFERELTASHARALIAARVTDIDSSNQHTIKPWFSTRTAQAARVEDLSADGFLLVGGRLDVIAKVPVPTLVYRHREHFISLTEMPAAIRKDVNLGQRSVDGFQLISWKEGDTLYYATSDIAMLDLELFAKKFQAAALKF